MAAPRHPPKQGARRTSGSKCRLARGGTGVIFFHSQGAFAPESFSGKPSQGTGEPAAGLAPAWQPSRGDQGLGQLIARRQWLAKVSPATAEKVRRGLVATTLVIKAEHSYQGYVE